MIKIILDVTFLSWIEIVRFESAIKGILKNRGFDLSNFSIENIQLSETVIFADESVNFNVSDLVKEAKQLAGL